MTAAKVREALAQLQAEAELHDAIGADCLAKSEQEQVAAALSELAALEEVAEAAIDYRANNGPDFTLKSCKHPYLCTCAGDRLFAAIAKVRQP